GGVDGSRGAPPNLRLQIQNLHWTLRPVVLPAHHQIAPRGVVPVLRKVPAPILKLHPHPLPPVPFHAAQRLALGKRRLHPPGRPAVPCTAQLLTPPPPSDTPLQCRASARTAPHTPRASAPRASPVPPNSATAPASAPPGDTPPSAPHRSAPAAQVTAPWPP